ncbi:glycosyltransferase family 4 protein [Soonwooa sp.]|uniref:glycosyltransferase family 4 protein n=1 Tax=Soonwooa sp. TaxID=1938592 RepID=UPI0028A8EBD8|nr:glycosyltransferase family 4 protein [Soonwooa sp.]
MKLVYITNGINGSGGLERVLSIKASYLADELGYEVHILVLNHSDQNRFYSFSEKIQFHSIDVGGNPISYFFKYKTGIQNVVTKINPDIILVCDDGLKGFFLPTIIKTNAKWIYERHVSKLIEANDKDGSIKKIMTKGKWLLMSHLAKKYDRFIVLTDGNKKEWTSLMNIDVISNPLSFFPDESSNLDDKIIICVGKISYQKGQDLLIKAWQIVHEQFSDWQLHLYGKENLNYLNTNELENNVFFFPPAKDIEQKYLQSSIYVMSSRFEGFGMVLTEAMACGVPCVSFDCDYGPSDIISDSVDGFLVAKDNTTELAEKIMALISDEELRKKMGIRAKENVQKYLPERIVKQWNELFLKTINND